MIKIYKKVLKITLVLCLLIFSAYVIQPFFVKMIRNIPTLNSREALITLSLIYIFGNFLILPVGLPLNIIAGSLWGTFRGGLLINALATFVAVISFLLARKFGIEVTESLFGRYAFFRKFKAAIVRYDWQFIAMTRINPIAPFSLSNYGFGLIPELSFPVYFIATVLANLLPCFIFSGIGATLKNAALENPDIHHFILDTGIILLLIFGLITLKMMTSQKFKQPTLIKDTSV
jgi:uncharacterized membrane protein YdjX (TVP38/TMEM64 family)